MPFTASDFASWVFDKEVGQRRSLQPMAKSDLGAFEGQSYDREAERLRIGHLAHFMIEEMRRNHFPYGWKVHDDKLWSVDYCDTGETSDILESSILQCKTDKRKLRGKPDVVLFNRHDHHVIIVERKTTNKSIEELRWGRSDPSTWPNCQAQLWAYAHLDKYIGAQRISLILQPWFWNETQYLQMGDTIPPIEFKADKSFDDRNLKRFENYGGVRLT